MNVNLSAYAGKNICVACSGGRDSMCLLHYLHSHASEYGIVLSALNCDHGIRGDASARDSAFVKEWCAQNGIPLESFAASGFRSEEQARRWRHLCYLKAAEKFGAVIATAHHLDDNAETVLFNLARGSALAGVCGISDGVLRVTYPEDERTAQVQVIRPLIGCSRRDIDGYIAENGVPFVTDESNFTDDYTRNKIRHNVLPELESAVPGAARAVYRFSRLAAEDEKFIQSQLKARNILEVRQDCCIIKFCEERALFNRAAVNAIKGAFGRKDYTLSHLETLFSLQYAEVGRTFEFLNLTAYKEQGAVALCENRTKIAESIPFAYGKIPFDGTYIDINADITQPTISGALRFDCEKIPENSEIRTRRTGDKFTKFGGGTKSLGDYFTDKKIPLRLRDRLPLIAVGNDILAVCGVEISDKIKTDENTEKAGYILYPITL